MGSYLPPISGQNSGYYGQAGTPGLYGAVNPYAAAGGGSPTSSLFLESLDLSNVQKSVGQLTAPPPPSGPPQGGYQPPMTQDGGYQPFANNNGAGSQFGGNNGAYNVYGQGGSVVGSVGAGPADFYQNLITPITTQASDIFRKTRSDQETNKK